MPHLIGVSFVVAMLVTWPDVPWNALLVTGLLVTAVVPFLVHQWTRTIWMALDRAFMPDPERPEPPPPGQGTDHGTTRTS